MIFQDFQTDHAVLPINDEQAVPIYWPNDAPAYAPMLGSADEINPPR